MTLCLQNSAYSHNSWHFWNSSHNIPPITRNCHLFIHVKSPSLGGRLPLFDPISLLNIHLPPRSGNLPLFGLYHLPIIFSLKRENCIEFCNENALLSQQNIHNVQHNKICIIWWVLSHYKEWISHHFQNFSWNLNVDRQKLMARNGFAQNLPLWQDAKREISLFSTFPTWHVWLIYLYIFMISYGRK